jgi:photosystem II stability/assembly factor-like uncharacterized protein
MRVTFFILFALMQFVDLNAQWKRSDLPSGFESMQSTLQYKDSLLLFSYQNIYKCKVGNPWKEVYTYDGGGDYFGIDTTTFIIHYSSRLLFRSQDYCNSWDTLKLPITEECSSYYITSSDSLIICHDYSNNSIFTSANYGQSWIQISTPKEVTSISSICHMKNITLITTGSGKMYASSNFKDWIEFDEISRYVQEVRNLGKLSHVKYFYTINKLYTYNTENKVYKKIGLDSLLIAKELSEGYPLNYFCQDSIILIKVGSKIIKSTDQGATWDKTYGIPDSTFSNNGIVFHEDGDVFGLFSFKNGETGGIYKLSKLSNAWSALKIPSYNSSWLNTILTSKRELYFGTGDKMFRTLDKGDTWIDVTNGIKHSTSFMLFTDGIKLFSSHYQGGKLYVKSEYQDDWVSIDLFENQVVSSIIKGNAVYYVTTMSNDLFLVDSSFKKKKYIMNLNGKALAYNRSGLHIMEFNRNLTDKNSIELIIDENGEVTDTLNILDNNNYNIGSNSYVEKMLFAGTRKLLESNNQLYTFDAFNNIVQLRKNPFGFDTYGNKNNGESKYVTIEKYIIVCDNYITSNYLTSNYRLYKSIISSSNDYGLSWKVKFELNYDTTSCINPYNGDNYADLSIVDSNVILTSSKGIYRSYNFGGDWIQFDSLDDVRYITASSDDYIVKKINGSIYQKKKDQSLNVIQASTGYNSYCENESFEVPICVYGKIKDSSKFSILLSDYQGRFDKQVEIGTGIYVKGAKYYAKIPVNTPPGNRYRIKATNFKDTSFDNGFDITINSTPKSMLFGKLVVPSFSESIFSTELSEGSSYAWEILSGDAVFTSKYRNVTSIKFNQIGIVTLKLTHTTKYGCIDEKIFTIQVKSPLDIQSNEFSVVTISPNPTGESDQFLVRFTETPNQDVSIELLDMLGSIHYSNTIQAGSESCTIPVLGLSSGMYMLRVRMYNEVFLEKVIVN